MNKKCAVYRGVEIIGKKWSLLIILEIYKGSKKKKRYSEIKKSLPDITPKILSARLKELEREGVITKKIDARKYPIKSEYCLTRQGQDFIKIIKDLKKWSLSWRCKNPDCKNRDCETCKL